MSYQTILVHVDLSTHAPERIAQAARLARHHGARLVGAAMLGVSRHIFPNGYNVQPGTLSASFFAPLADNARRALARFDSIVAPFDIPHAARFVCDQADDALARLARFADLVVISQDDRHESMPDMAVYLQEYVILNCGRPVLVVPCENAGEAGENVLVAWNGSREASGAMLAAVPLLRRAPGVVVVALAATGEGEAAFRSEAPDLTDFLAQHGIAAKMIVRRPVHDDIGEDLLAIARERDCGLVVMGCYGHTRFHELCLGGASRTVLANTRLPVLFAH